MSIQAISITDLYTALGWAVKYYPAPADAARPCDALQAFRVFGDNRLAELAEDGLGTTPCDGDRPYFFSRLWEEQGRSPNASVKWRYPLLYAFDKRFAVDKPGKPSARTRHEIEVGVVDVLPEDQHKGCVGCDGRAIPQVFADTSRHLLNALQFLSGVIYATVAPWHPAESRLYHSGYLEAALAAGSINSFAETSSLLYSAGVTLENLDFNYFERESGRVYGTFTNLIFAEKGCEQPVWNFDTTTFNPTAQEAGRCTTC